MNSPNDPKSYVILGGTGGVGSATARLLRDRGANVLLGARNSEKLASLADELNAEWAVVEAADPAAIESAVQKGKEAFGRLDGVVNCMGTLLLKPAHLTTDAEWQNTLTVNLSSSFALLRSAVKTMTPGGGAVVLISSAAAQMGLANHEAIAAAKAGIEGMARAAAASYAHRGIRVNAVAPGLVKTPLTSDITGNEKSLAASVKMHALGRAGEAQDIASAIVFLLSPEQSWITGQVLGVDGGLSRVRSRG